MARAAHGAAARVELLHMLAALLRTRFRYPTRRYRLAFAASLLLAGLAVSCAQSVDQRDAVHIAKFDAQVNPVSARYIDRVIDEAERKDAKAVVIQLDTPGGLVSSMEDIVQRIQSSKVPVIVWVGPSGAKAASAGTFITMSAHVAAMAPSTRIGAAHPVDASGGDIEGDLGEKVENDAAAYARSIAEERGRNQEWAEDAVRDSVSASATEAVEKDVVDYVARDIDDLLQQAEGHTVSLAGEPFTIEGVADAPRASNGMTFFERVLLVISDPNIAFLLLSLGGLGLLIELLNPGTLFPGTFGVISLILAFFVLGTLPVNWAGVALILLAFALFAAEFFVSGFGALGAGGVVALIAGGLILTSSSDPEFQVNRWFLIGTGIFCGISIMSLITAIVKTRRMPAAIGSLAMVGNKAIARSDLEPDGFVFIEGARWKAVADENDAPIRRGEAVTITGVKGLTLFVKRRETVADNLVVNEASTEPSPEVPPGPRAERWPPPVLE
jgi:membrane-bound serine protease (ClpP class)